MRASGGTGFRYGGGEADVSSPQNVHCRDSVHNSIAENRKRITGSFYFSTRRRTGYSRSA